MMKRFFTLSEAVDYSGICRTNLYLANKNSELVFTKFGKSTRIAKADLDTFLDKTGIRVAA